MDNKIKCSLEEHKDKIAIKYCSECRIYMCNKCENYHSSSIFKNHHLYNINDEGKIFTDFCQEKNHNNKLDYYCKNHNQLCCVSCLCKLDQKFEGQHKDCKVCYIEKIKDEKKDKLKENLLILKDLEIKFDKSFESLKKIYENAEKKKEDIKLQVQNTFTKIRNAINNREDEILLKLDNLFDIKYFSQDLVKKGEKLPKIIKSLLEKEKLMNEEWNNNNLIYYIHNCIEIENSINNILNICDKINKFNKTNIKVFFSPNDNQLKSLIKSIKFYGKIYYNEYSPKKNVKIIKNDSTLINISEKMLCDYPFQEDKNNHTISAEYKNLLSFGRDKSFLTVFNNLKCIDTNGLLAAKLDIDLNRDWTLYFEYCKKDWSPGDWSHIFSFGTHFKFGGDDSYYAITLETKPRDGYQLMKLTSKLVGDGKWHKIIATYQKETKLLQGFVDNILIESRVDTLKTTNGFYFGGKGWTKDFSMYLRNFKFFLDLNLTIEELNKLIN